MKIFSLLLLIFLNTLYSQQYNLSGNVYNVSSNEMLPFANVRIDNSFSGTSSNAEGKFQLKLSTGNYTVIISYIGYISDTVTVSMDRDRNLSVYLTPVSVNMPEITVFPDLNPAEGIIKNALERKKIRKEKLVDYSFNAYTKTIIKTTKDISANRTSDYSLTQLDTGEVKITALLENESRGYFKNPDYYKDVIIARKQSENLPPAANILSGGRVLVDFYSEEIPLVENPLIGPLADNTLDFYYFILTDTLAIDNQNVFKIYFEPIDTTDPGLVGDLYIKDKTFDLIKVEAGLTEAANPMGLFDNFFVMQQFLEFDEGIYLPVDYRFDAAGNFLGIAKFAFRLSSIFSSYVINSGIPDDFFGYAIVTVKPDADEKDSLYWSSIQTLPSTGEEYAAYLRIDSLESVPVSFWDNFSPFSSELRLSENLTLSGPLDLYNFNKVEGHIIKYGFDFNDSPENRLYFGGDFSYGFSDDKLKKEFYSLYYLGEYRTHYIHLKYYDKLTSHFSESDNYGDFISALLSLISKYDFRHYYYTKGGELTFSSEVLPFLKLTGGYLYREDLSAVNGSDFSFFKTDKHYSENKPILKSNTGAFRAGFRLDFRSYIEDGFRRIRVSEGEDFILLSGNATFSNDWINNSDYEFQIYELGIYGKINPFRNTDLRFELNGIISDGSVPYHWMYALPGNIESMGTSFSFRTLGVGEVFGDRVISAGIDFDLKDELFRVLDFPYLRKWGVTLGLHLNSAWVDINYESRSIIPVDYILFKHPFYEAGFRIGQRDFPVNLEFTWKLNHLGGNNFVWGVNVFDF